MNDSVAGTNPVFPQTRWSIIRGAADPAGSAYQEAIEQLAGGYWRPIYAYFRRKWSRPHEEARDLTQDFFAALCERNFLKDLAPEQGRFRSYVMAALDNFVRLRHRYESALKRGGGARHFALEIGEGFEPAAEGSVEEGFLREWAGAILEASLVELERELRAGGMEKAYEIFVSREVEAPAEGEPSYEELSARYGVSVTDVRNYLYRARKKLREIVFSKVRETVASEEEAEAEMKDLFEGMSA